MWVLFWAWLFAEAAFYDQTAESMKDPGGWKLPVGEMAVGLSTLVGLMVGVFTGSLL